MDDNAINEAVARKLGWIQVTAQCEGTCSTDWHGPASPDLSEIRCAPPNYCHSIDAAWQIVER